jgi:hypothetical protein
MEPGDCLLYSAKGLFGAAISVKTWHSTAHCEIYVGNCCSAAARDGLGVDIYPVRGEQLQYILRPKLSMNISMALAWFIKQAQGQKYDWLGLLRFTWRKKYVFKGTDNRMFCSEFLTRFYRAGGFEPFSTCVDADDVAPFEFLTSPMLDLIWKAEA